MRIKKHSNKNEYLLTEDGIWVRNFYKEGVPKTDINRLTSQEDYQTLLENEMAIRKLRIPSIEGHVYRNIIIVSDGFDFSERQKLLSKFPPKEVAIIAVNRSLAKWDLVGNDCPSDLKRAVTFFLVNNPYKECMKYVPTKHRYFPKCIISNRTNSEFAHAYRGNLYTYSSVRDKYYFGLGGAGYDIDDYRNPICAAIGLAHKFNVEKLLLFCCDDSFEDERPGAVQLENGLWSYPQQLMSQRTIDANLHWLKEHGVKIGNYSSGAKMKNATYISEEDVIGFFEEEENEI